MVKLKSKIFILAFIILSVIPIIALFHSGLPLTHDGQDHVARIANFYQNLTEGNLIPRWAPNLNWGYGHPILEFLYPLPSYIASFFHFFGFSLVDSTKIVFGMGIVLSMIFMYLWLSLFTSRYSALFGALLYGYAPYRFVDLYVRGDIGENLAFAFIPLVLFFIYKIYKKSDYKFTIFGGVSLAFLILSHNAISLMFVLFIVIYVSLLIYLSGFNKQLMLNSFFLILIGFGLSVFFWLPALLEGRYTLRDILTVGAYARHFVSIPRLIYGPWSYGGSGQFSVQFGFFQWIALLASPLVLYKSVKNKYNFYFTLALIVFSLMSVFIMLPVSNFVWSRIMLLQNFQFPWRFLAIIVFTTAVLGALVFDKLQNKFNLKYLFILCAIIIVVIGSFYFRPKAYLYKPVSFYTGVYNSTTDTGESSPIWSVRFMEHSPKAHMEIIDGSATIKEVHRTSTNHEYQLIVNKKTLFEENTLYFPGWGIKANGNPLSVQFQNRDYRGQMLFFLDKGNYNVKVEFKETKLRAISDAVSAVLLFNILGFLGFRFVKRYFY